MAKRKKPAGGVIVGEDRNHIAFAIGASRNTENDCAPERRDAAGAVAAPLEAPPASVDLRAAWWDIGKPGYDRLCVGWGSTDGLSRLSFRQGRQA